MKKILWLLVSLLVIVLDQWTKQLAMTHLPLNVPQVILPVFNLTLSLNQGAAFSLFANMGGWQIPVLAFISAAVTIALVIWLLRTPRGQCLIASALSLVIGGAVGNLIDRLRHDYVVDFIQLHWHGYYFAVFNVADIAVTVGAGLLILSLLRQK